MLNPFVVKENAALVLACALPAIGTVLSIMYFGLWWGLAVLAVLTALFVIVGKILLRNPFSEMLKGKGILVLDLNSRGVINPFVVRVEPPFVKGKGVSDVFDRDAVMNLSPPKKARKPAKERGDGGILIDIGNEELNAARFGLFQYPVFIYNSQLKSLLTKDWFSEQEKAAFAEHNILYAKHSLDIMNERIFNFSRGVVDLLNPSGLFGEGRWKIWLLIGGVVLLLVLFGAPIINAIKGFVGGARDVVAPSVSAGAETVKTVQVRP